jgi:hypothetical protein
MGTMVETLDSFRLDIRKRDSHSVHKPHGGTGTGQPVFGAGSAMRAPGRVDQPILVHRLPNSHRPCTLFLRYRSQHSPPSLLFNTSWAIAARDDNKYNL